MNGRAILLLAVLTVPGIASAAEVSRAQYLMGTVCEITVDGDANQASAAFAEAARVERLISTWKDDSELSRLNRCAADPVRGGTGTSACATSAELRALLDEVVAWRDRTGGAFEPQIRPLIDAWLTRQNGAIPAAGTIAAALAQIRSGRAAFEEGGFGKGYALDRMMQTISAPDVVINFGGQLAVRGRHDVSIADPLHRDRPAVTLTLKDESLSTSSGSEKTFDVNGRRFTHLIDPRTGDALPPRGSVSVIAPSALEADVLSTALYVMGPERGAEWARANNVRAIFISDQGQVTTTSDEIAELKREIDILSREIEALKSGQEKVVARADTQQYGLGAAASKVYRAEPGVSFGGYGEFVYDNPEHGTASADVVRAVLYTGYKFNPRTVFNSELEVEHASTEFAGDESRGAEGGSASVEFAYLDYLLRPSANVRVGLVLLPTGLINEQHEPTAYFGTHRPEVEDRILPTTWSEIGAGMFGDIGRFTYRGYVVTGLESSRFSAEDGVHEGKQGGASAAAEDLAVVGRLDFHPFEGTLFGGSLYSGGSGQGAGYRGRVTLAELHADSKFRGVSLRALAARGTIGDAAAISERTGQTIGSSLGGWYVEGAYDLASILRRPNISLTSYVRYERLDTQREVAAGFTRDPENDRRVTTLGIAFKPISQTVIKTDIQRIRTRAGTSDRTFNIGAGYIF